MVIRTLVLLLAFLSLGAIAALGGCDSDGDTTSGAGGGVAAGGSGGMPAATGGTECVSGAECDDGNACTDDTCIVAECQYSIVADGVTPATVSDPDPDDCFIPQCLTGTLTDVAATGSACALAAGGVGVCDAEGVCSCAAPGPTAAHYVDPIDGVDDATHGGAAGSCAFKTLTYALEQSQGDIHVAPGTYSTAMGETLPFVLGDFDRIFCEEVGGQRPLLTGKGTYATWSSVVEMTGAETAVIDCDIVGTGNPTYCVDMVGAALPSTPLILKGSDVSGCLNGVRLGATGRLVEGNYFHDHQFTGVFNQGPTNFSWVDNNQFDTNGQQDIFCNLPDPDFDGTGNTGPNGMAPSCAGCVNCPFQ